MTAADAFSPNVADSAIALRPKKGLFAAVVPWQRFCYWHGGRGATLRLPTLESQEV